MKIGKADIRHRDTEKDQVRDRLKITINGVGFSNVFAFLCETLCL